MSGRMCLDFVNHATLQGQTFDQCHLRELPGSLQSFRPSGRQADEMHEVPKCADDTHRWL